MDVEYLGGAVALTHGAGHSYRTEHMVVQHHFIRSRVKCKRIKIQKPLASEMIADTLTKNFGRAKHDYFARKQGMASRVSGSARD